MKQSHKARDIALALLQAATLVCLFALVFLPAQSPRALYRTLPHSAVLLVFGLAVGAIFVQLLAVAFRSGKEAGGCIGIIALYGCGLWLAATDDLSTQRLGGSLAALASVTVGLALPLLFGVDRWRRVLPIIVLTSLLYAAFEAYVFGYAIRSGSVLRLAGRSLATGELALLSILVLPFIRLDWPALHGFKHLRTTALIVASVALALTMSRAGLLAACVGYAATKGRDPLHVHLKRCALVIGAMVFVLLFRYTGSANQKSIAGSDFGHIQQLSGGIDAFRHHPLFGMGIGRVDFDAKYLNSERVQLMRSSNPLNLWLYLLAEGGLVSGILLSALAILTFRIIRKSSSSAALACSLLSFVAYSAFSIDVLIPEKMFTTAIFFSILGLAYFDGCKRPVVDHEHFATASELRL